MPYLICKDLSLGYNGKSLSENINFTLEKGDYLCIIGANGSGKTTLAKAILNLHQALGGSIVMQDSDGAGYLPQQTDVQKDFPASVKEIVMSGCIKKTFSPFYTKEQKQLAQTNMEKLGIAHLAKSCYRNLSGGQQQRVLLARALCSARQLLLLDEPVAGLDPDAASEMYSVVEKLNRDGTTVIMITHDIPAVLKYASHVLCLGKTVFFGTKEECEKQGLLNGRLYGNE